MITKTTMVVIFSLQNSHLLTLSLPTEEVLQVNGQNIVNRGGSNQSPRLTMAKMSQ